MKSLFMSKHFSLRSNTLFSARTFFRNTFFLLTLCLVFGALKSYASATVKAGAVMARTMVLDDNNQPILVEYNTDGSEARVVAIPSDYANRVRELSIISATEYLLQQARLQDFIDRNTNNLASGGELLSRSAFEGGSYPTADGQSSISPGALPDYVKSVFIRGRSNRLLNNPSQLVLLSFSVDLTQQANVPNSGSVVLNTLGQVVASSTNNIAPRVGFFGNPNDEQDVLQYGRGSEDEIFGPVPNTLVEVSRYAYPGSLAVTDDEGKYAMSFLLPYCPGGYDFTTDMWAEIRYVGFNPNGAAILPYYLRVQDWTYCYDLPPYIPTTLGGQSDYINAIGVLAASSIPLYNIDLKVDVTFLSGRVGIYSPGIGYVNIDETTEYHVNPANLGSTEQSTDPEIESTFSRVTDTATNFAPNGMLTSISEQDLKDTDVLIFRESTGKLVLERKGLPENEADQTKDTAVIDDYFYYRLMLRGRADGNLNIGGGNNRSSSYSGTWNEWASEYKMAEPFQIRDADHLKPGEWVRLVIINRATGYMATQRIQLTSVAGNGEISMPVPDMVLLPPNLKIWAERSFDVESGLTQGEERRYLIGAEGTGLTSDATIEVYSEWFDEEGRPLPEGLSADNGEQFGLTGRLAKVLAQDSLGAVSVNGLANFPIAPGRQTQVLKVRDNLIAPEHFYIHVSGTQKDEGPDFDSVNINDSLQGRPNNLTPFLAPLANEAFDLAQWQQYLITQDAFDSGEISERPVKPAPNYVWSYRPEYQFSQFELEIADVERETLNSGTESLFDDPESLIYTSDELLTIFYELTAGGSERLSPIDGPQQLVLSVGLDEFAVSTDSGQVEFSNIENLAALTAEDLLTIRLYSNQDAGNILWEHAFNIVQDRKFKRSHSLAQYNDQPIYNYETVDSFELFSVSLSTQSLIQVDLLDADRNIMSNLIGSSSYDRGVQQFVLLRKDLDPLLSRAGTDGFILITTTPSNGNPVTEKHYAVNLKDSTHGQMLGQIIEHDTLIQRGSITLRREDLSIPGPGPQLGFSRTYSNEISADNDGDIMSPGWSHNHNIYLKVLVWGDGEPEYENGQPGWVGSTRGIGEPLILDFQTMTALKDRPVSPSLVAVSNGGTFKREVNDWKSQRGFHGTLKQIDAGGGWEYRSKDGTVYSFSAPLQGQDKAFVHTITDRNGNTLTYDYITVKNQRLVSSITDQASRSLSFEYDTTDSFDFRLVSVKSSVGIDLEFEYFPRGASAYDPKAGMLKSFTRDEFYESYSYSSTTFDPLVNLSSVTDPNGQVTTYEYYDMDDVPAELISFAPGIEKTDVVKKVSYPGGDYATFNYPITADENKRDIVDLRGHTKTYTLNPLGNPTLLEEPLGKSTTFEWSASMGEPDNVLRKKTEVEKNASWEYEYDALGNLIKETDPYDKITEQTWDPLFSVLTYRKDKNGHTFRQELDDNGNVLKEHQSATINGTPGETTTTHTYGDGGPYLGVRKSTENGRGHTTQYTYDAFGNIETITNPEGGVTRYVSNDRGLRLSSVDEGKR